MSVNWIEQSEDVKWSEMDPQPTIEDGLKILNGATVTVDEPAEIQVIDVEEGTLMFEVMEGTDFNNPTMNFRDHPEAGIKIGNGEIDVEDSPVENGDDSTFSGMIDERPMVVLRNDYDLKEKSIELTKNRWNFLPYSLEWKMHNYHLIELYNNFPMITYWEELGNELQQRAIKFNHGISNIARAKKIELHKNTMDGGSELKLTYDRTTAKAWEIQGIFSKRFEGKAKMKRLYHLADTLQRDSPMLLICEELIRYVMIQEVDHEVGDNFYEWTMNVEEVKSPDAQAVKIQ